MGKLVASLLRMQDTPYTSCLVMSGLRGRDTERMIEREREESSIALYTKYRWLTTTCERMKGVKG